MHKTFGALPVQLAKAVQKGLRVRPLQTPHTGNYPIVTDQFDKSSAWIGITLEAGQAGDIIPIMPPYGTLVMAKVECEEINVRTGYWVATENNGYFSCHTGAGEVTTGIIVTPILNEQAAGIGSGKVVEAMILTGRFVFDGFYAP